MESSRVGCGWREERFVKSLFVLLTKLRKAKNTDMEPKHGSPVFRVKIQYLESRNRI